MSAGEIYERILQSLKSPPERRYTQLLELHREAMSRFTAAVTRIDADEAARTSSDGRAIAQVVAHIADWDRFFILAASEMAAGVRWPQFMELQGYLDENGERLNFDTVTAFNAYSAKRTESWEWQRIQEMAVRSAGVLYALFSNAAILNVEILEATRIYKTEEFGFPLSIPVGWYLWVIAIGHELEEHALDLNI